MWTRCDLRLLHYYLVILSCFSRDQWQGYYGSSHESLLSVYIFQFPQKYNAKLSSHKLEKNRDFFLCMYLCAPHEQHPQIGRALTLFNEHCSCFFSYTAITSWQLCSNILLSLVIWMVWPAQILALTGVSWLWGF